MLTSVHCRLYLFSVSIGLWLHWMNKVSNVSHINWLLFVSVHFVLSSLVGLQIQKIFHMVTFSSSFSEFVSVADEKFDFDISLSPARYCFLTFHVVTCM